MKTVSSIILSFFENILQAFRGPVSPRLDPQGLIVVNGYKIFRKRHIKTPINQILGALGTGSSGLARCIGFELVNFAEGLLENNP